MKVRRTNHFTRAYTKAPREIQAAFDKQLRFLLQNLRHPSLHAKKYDEGKDWWQARVTQDWRFYFTIAADTYILEDIIRHPKQLSTWCAATRFHPSEPSIFSSKDEPGR